jgi:hypothetical protein
MLWVIGKIKDSDSMTRVRKLKGEQTPQQACASNADFHS